MDISALQNEIAAALEREGLTRAAASRLARGNPNLVKNIMNGHMPRIESLARLAEVLNLDLYFGPRRPAAAPPAPTDAAEPDAAPRPPSGGPGPDVLGILVAIRALNKVVHSLDPAAGTRPAAPDDGPEPRPDDALHVIGDEWFRSDWMARRGLDPAHCRLAEVFGSEMEPTLPHGTVVLVDRSRTVPLPMSVYLLRAGGRHRVRRLNLEDDRWVALGDHPQCPPRPLPADAEIVGRVVWSAREHPSSGRDGLGVVFEILGLVAALRSRVAARIGESGLADAERDALRDRLRSMPTERFGLLIERLTADALARPDGIGVLRRALSAPAPPD